MSKEQDVTLTSHNNRYATQLNSRDKEALLDSLRSYHSEHPYSFHKLARFMIGVSAMTLWRICEEKTQRVSQKSLYHIYRFLKKVEPYSPIRTQLVNGNWIRFSKNRKPRFY